MKVEYRFSIDTLRPETLSLGRLVAYLTEVSKILGDEPGLHFTRVEAGSAVLVAWADEPTAPRIDIQMERIRAGEIPSEIQKSVANLNKLLREDQGVGLLSGSDTNVLEFPGRKVPQTDPISLLQQPTTIQGQLIRIGGRDKTVHFHLADGGRIWSGSCNRTLAREMASHLFGATLRVAGNGGWCRTPAGIWELTRFTASTIETLDDLSLAEALEKLRGLGAFGDGPDWAELRKDEESS
ncbi:hypothetical protein FBZ89_11722 [Nitrospirillum amazonense]|uniref:Uncharacterized protein n=1 Tax=Nitrospirillum amazonense TaxID=28077 RepID=A0A560EXQ3_9PROT|nr:hypothetical protein [Nitrospirillum amazonense]TWB14158.1 hypothetical protein FBZ89_11722 [Nitrospirillum amazonense]